MDSRVAEVLAYGRIAAILLIVFGLGYAWGGYRAERMAESRVEEAVSNAQFALDWAERYWKDYCTGDRNGVPNRKASGRYTAADNSRTTEPGEAARRSGTESPYDNLCRGIGELHN